MTKTAIPTAAAELEEMLADGSRIRGLFNEDGSGKPELKEFLTNHARAVLNKDEELKAQIREGSQQVLAEFLKTDKKSVERLNLDPSDTVSPAAKRGAQHNPKAMGASIDKEFVDAVDFFRAVHNPNADAERMGRVRNALSSTIPSEGGFLVPETLRSELLRVALETAVVRPRARVIPMDTLRVAFPAVDSTSNVSSVYGGVVGYWTEEGASLTASNPAFGRIVLEAKKLTAYTAVPNELITDAQASFMAFISEVFPEALAWYEDTAFFSGSGVGEPLGFLNSDCAVSVAAETGQSAATIVWENIVKAFARMLPGSLNRAVWIVSPDTFPQLATMALSVGTGGSAIWLNNGASGPPMTILGRPVIVSEKASALGTAGDINFVDFGFYLIGDRQAMTARSSEHVNFATDQTAFRIIQRVDGRAWLNSAVTPANSGSTLSPIVKVATRS